jgi:hypothetical protein
MFIHKIMLLKKDVYLQIQALKPTVMLTASARSIVSRHYTHRDKAPVRKGAFGGRS